MVSRFISNFNGLGRAQAKSQDPAVFKPACELLNSWEIQPGFYSCMQVRMCSFGWLSRGGWGQMLCGAQYLFELCTQRNHALPGTTPCLLHVQSIYANQGVSVHVRMLAIMYLKNGVDRYWRIGAPQYVRV